MFSDPCKNLLNSQILNTIEICGKINLCGIKYIKKCRDFKRPRHNVQEGMPVISRDKTTRLPMQKFEFAPSTLQFLTGNVPIYQFYCKNYIPSKIKHKWLENKKGRHFKVCFAHWPDLKNPFQLFANFRHQSVHKAPGATLKLFIAPMPEQIAITIIRASHSKLQTGPYYQPSGNFRPTNNQI